jgi:hypothetical protein
MSGQSPIQVYHELHWSLRAIQERTINVNFINHFVVFKSVLRTFICLVKPSHVFKL